MMHSAEKNENSVEARREGIENYNYGKWDQGGIFSNFVTAVRWPETLDPGREGMNQSIENSQSLIQSNL